MIFFINLNRIQIEKVTIFSKSKKKLFLEIYFSKVMFVALHLNCNQALSILYLLFILFSFIIVMQTPVHNSFKYCTANKEKRASWRNLSGSPLLSRVLDCRPPRSGAEPSPQHFLLPLTSKESPISRVLKTKQRQRAKRKYSFLFY